MTNKYVMPELSSDIDESCFDFKPFGNCVMRPPPPWEPSTRTDIIHYNHSIHSKELHSDLELESCCPHDLNLKILDIIKEYWDCFVTSGCKRTIIGYVFHIDTGNATPVCCKKPAYGYFESEIILKQIQDLLINTWIRRCGGPWGSLLVLAPKPHQEQCTSIDNFIWRMCVSYRGVNAVTKPFHYPIPRCDASIDAIGKGSVSVFIIVLDCRQGYHQIAVHEPDQEKLSFLHQMMTSTALQSCHLVS